MLIYIQKNFLKKGSTSIVFENERVYLDITTMQQRNKASVTGKNTKIFKASVSTWSSHNE